jgi:hypothetical protein
MAQLSEFAAAWGSIYANHAVLRTLVTFAHVASLIVGGGAAIAADRATLIAIGGDGEGRGRQLDALHGTHSLVVYSLALVAISGLLLFAADVDALLYSRVFWIKMTFVGLLVVNGTLLYFAEGRARRHDLSAWRTLRVTALASVALWLLATFAGVALLNIG